MFSIVIPLYNKELSIESTIQSVLNQTYQNYEIIVVNDGSSDSGAKVVQNINDNRIRMIHQKNQGVSAARNRGIMEANNDWIAFLDGDDLWKKNHLEEILRMMAAFPMDKVHVTSFEYSDKRKLFKHSRSNSIFKIENYFKEALKEALIWTSIIVVHKSCFKETGCFDIGLNRGEDTDLWVRLASNFDIIKSSVNTAVYRIDAENRTTLSKDLDSTYIYHIGLNEIIDLEKRKYFEEMIANRLYQYIRSKDITSFRKLKKRYPSIKYINIANYSIKHVSKKLLKDKI